MNVVREIERINKAEIARIAAGTQGGSWHDQYKDSARIFVGGLPTELTEGDVITIFSQYGEPVDINLPRDKQTGKTRGFGFLMYEDQKSTILAVDNLNGAKILNRTLRVDHVSHYKDLEKGEDGKFKESERESFNARPDLFTNNDKNDSDSDGSEAGNDDLLEGIDPDDPMAAYLISQRKEERALAIANGTYSKKSKSSKCQESESKEQRRLRKEERKRKREERARRAGSKNEDIGRRRHRDSRSPSPDRRERRRSRSPYREPRSRERDDFDRRRSDRPDDQRRRSYSSDRSDSYDRRHRQ